MGRFLGGFSELELKTQLNLASLRFQRSIARRSELVRQHKEEIALMLAEKPYPKEEKARIRAESLIREDNAVEAMEILQLTCKTLHEHVRLLSNNEKCPSEYVSSVSTLIWVSQRLGDVPELQKIIRQFHSKYGKKFLNAAITNAGGICDERVVRKFGTDNTTPILVQVRASRYINALADLTFEKVFSIYFLHLRSIKSRVWKKLLKNTVRIGNQGPSICFPPHHLFLLQSQLHSHRLHLLTSQFHT
jgi:vacuolar protein sorting-associated protein IST1